MTDPKGEYVDDWKPTSTPSFRCRCGSNDIIFREWESSCGGFEDIHYKCRSCRREWWVESADA